MAAAGNGLDGDSESTVAPPRTPERDDETAPLWEPTWYYLDGMWYSDTGEVVPDKKKGKKRAYGCNNAKERLKEELERQK